MQYLPRVRRPGQRLQPQELKVARSQSARLVEPDRLSGSHSLVNALALTTQCWGMSFMIGRSPASPPEPRASSRA